jgi:NAD(P)-dependent dehydrogenase (short-subunit alcohol dehydrogenase family)
VKVSEGRVLVTGASRGIGRAIAEDLVAAGARVFATGRDADALRSLRQTAPDRIATFEADLTDAAARKKLLDFATTLWDGLDGLVSAAGIVRYQEAAGMEEEALRAQLDVNLVAPALLIRDFAKHLRERETGGAVVVVGSTLATHPAPMTAAYAATKAGLTALARTFALELGAHDIRVNVVAPGLVDTDMIRVPRTPTGEAEPEGAERDEAVRAQLEELGGLSVLGRLGKPEEIAEAVRYLLDAPFVTGHVYVVDGGLTAR